MQALSRKLDTGPELSLRRELHRRGVRYRVDVAPLAQAPRRRADVVFTFAKVAVFVDRGSGRLDRNPIGRRRPRWPASCLPGRSASPCDVTINRILSRAMSRPSDLEIDRLSAIADAARETVSARGYRVDVAVGVDAAFSQGTSRAWLTRDLVMDAIGEAASHNAVDFRPVNGIGRELRSADRDGVIRTFRCLRAKRRVDGSLVVHTSSNSALVASPEESLYPEERWVFIYVVSAEGLLVDSYIAEVRGYIEGKPGRLQLGECIPVGRGTGTPLGGGFIPSDEDELEIFQDDEPDADDGETEAGS
jgi:DNA mismatch endonuclease Vsr